MMKISNCLGRPWQKQNRKITSYERWLAMLSKPYP